MSSSEDEGETLIQSVTNYHFVDDKEEPVCFSVLPIQWGEGDHPTSTKDQVFLYGIADDGNQKIYKRVTAWKFELLDEEPQISVLSKEKNWIKLVKPRKIFEDTIRTILITVWCIHIVKKNPEITGKPLWDQLQKIFSTYEVRPSESDLLKHSSLITEAVKHEETLSQSKFLVEFPENSIKKAKEVNEDDHTGVDVRINSFIDDGNEELNEDMTMAADGDESEEEESDLFDSVCCICDNGGELLCCEGRCMRSFHATIEDGEDSDCKTLGLSKAQVEAIQNFLCLNCQRKQHQCFACGKLGSSDKSSGAEVFSCVSATCGFFYHPNCVARLLHPTDEGEAEVLQKKIYAGESFTCPAHKCHKCKEREDKDVHDLHFAVCRRCPRAYHRKCLPKKIGFDKSESEEEEENEEEGIETRAWENLLPNNRILIYCLKHKIDEDLGTPIRNHIIFPHDEKKKTRLTDLQSGKGKATTKRKLSVDEDSSTEKKKPKLFEKMSSDVRGNSSTLNREKSFLGKDLGSSEKSKISEASRKALKDSSKSGSLKEDNSPPANKEWLSAAVGKLNSMLKKGSAHVKSNQQEKTSTKSEMTVKAPSHGKKLSSSPVFIDDQTKKRIIDLVGKKSSSITLEDVIKQHKVPSTHAYSSRSVIDKTITHGKVEGFVEAVRTALQKLEEGGSVDDAKAVCGPEVVNQILRWKNKLKVYLAPFLHGMRYTSFGRHFTKVDKLKEIVNKLHWYINDGDMVVDFCCGSNDFSWLMKEKIEETGKKCSFKNFDVIQPKNDFSFEKRDWMSVRPDELPTGSKLIMGLNPPFGVKAALANKFVDKALQFKPKLVILIVPPETERLDRKRPPYDLIWEDEEKLSGKSFYLPGSVDVNENVMDQWNVKAPLLYLWSRSDWTAKHKSVALKQGHTSSYQKDPRSEENRISAYQKEPRLEENQDEMQVSQPMDISPVIDPKFADVSNQMGDLPKGNVEDVSQVTMGVSRKGQSESSPAKQDTSGQRLTNGVENSREDRSKHSYERKRSRKKKKDVVDKTVQPRVMSETSPVDQTDHKTTVECQPSEGLEILSEKAVSEEGNQSLQPSFRVSGLDPRSGYGGSGTSISGGDLDDITKRYSSVGSSYLSENRRWSTDASNRQEYGGTGRSPYLKDLGEYRVEPDVQKILQRYGGNGPDSSSQMGRLLGQDTGIGRVGLSSTYGVPGTVPEPSYSSLAGSTMERYAPRLDELNHGRMGSFGSDTSQVSRSSIFDGRGSQFPAGGGYRPGFAPPSHPFPQFNSPGWLNE